MRALILIESGGELGRFTITFAHDGEQQHIECVDGDESSVAIILRDALHFLAEHLEANVLEPEQPPAPVEGETD